MKKHVGEPVLDLSGKGQVFIECKVTGKGGFRKVSFVQKALMGLNNFFPSFRADNGVTIALWDIAKLCPIDKIQWIGRTLSLRLPFQGIGDASPIPTKTPGIPIYSKKMDKDISLGTIRCREMPARKIKEAIDKLNLQMTRAEVLTTSFTALTFTDESKVLEEMADELKASEKKEEQELKARMEKEGRESAVGVITSEIERMKKEVNNELDGIDLALRTVSQTRTVIAYLENLRVQITSSRNRETPPSPGKYEAPREQDK